MSDIDPELLARSKRKFAGVMGADLVKKADDDEGETKAHAPKRITLDTLAKDESVLEKAKKLREEIAKAT